VSYKTYARLDPDGTVNSHIITAGRVPDGYDEVTDSAQVALIHRAQNRVIFQNGMFVRKQMIRFSVSKRTFLADGIDSISISVVGDIEDDRVLNVLVGRRGGRKATISKLDPLELVTTAPGAIGVTLIERTLIAEPIVVVAIEPEVPGAG
jgi:hypothetical protein